MGKISIADKYKGVDVKKVADICQRAYGLYEGNWVEVGPEEGCNNPTNEGKDRAIEMVGLLYHYLEPYNEQIRADYQSYKQLDLWEQDRAYEDGWVLCWLDWACDIYDTHIKFMEELRAKYQPQQPAVPTVGKPQQKKKRGRQVEPFRSVLTGTDKVLKEWRLQRLHKVVDGKKGKEVARLVLAAIESGWISRPTYTQMKEEFGEIGSKTGYNKYLEPKKYTEAEKLGAKNALNG